MIKRETETGAEAKIWSALETIPDPEIPVLSIVDLGIVRKVSITENGEPAITITATYTGCPAMDMIAIEIRMKLAATGYKQVTLINAISPAWTTDWMSEEGKQKLKEYGIAPPNSKQQVCDQNLFAEADAVQCPQCNSYNTYRISEFGSTACKALYQCNNCKEPFDYFKCH
ncbi:MAG: phenylacetate-CoA oxygenase subunit PaaJ [Chitinophagaceae bacterium]|nr:phenylacetate-CoA oxygenase subunit PaaJ [Chitinophagaceae bacterium]MBK8951088.1 phenylacetate-CoA oxygenase subunit PaaJ [Chitinophagaceae bacterium]